MTQFVFFGVNPRCECEEAIVYREHVAGGRLYQLLCCERHDNKDVFIEGRDMITDDIGYCQRRK